MEDKVLVSVASLQNVIIRSSDDTMKVCLAVNHEPYQLYLKVKYFQ